MHALLCLTLVVCGAEVDTTAADRDLARLTDEFIEAYLDFQPHVALELGLHDRDGRLADCRRASLDAAKTRFLALEKRLAAVAPDSLGPAARVDRAVALCELRHVLFRFDGADAYRRNPILYPRAVPIDDYLIRDFAPLADRVRSIVAIEKRLPELFAAARANLDPVLPRPLVETAVKVATGAAEFLERDLPTAVADLKDEALRKELEVANAAAIAEFKGYVKWLETERLPRADHRVALGREAFARMLREQELVELEPERILELGMRELRREQEIFAATAKAIDPSKPAIDVFRAIQEDHPTEQGLIPDTAKNVEAIRRFVEDRRLVTIPPGPAVRVVETPQFRRATSFASMASPGPFEPKAREAYYYVTPVDPGWNAAQKNEWLTAFNYYTTDIVSIHEAYPGHHLQQLHLNASAVGRVRKICSSYAFVEGWAHYTEQLLLDEGFPGDGDKLRAARYRLAQSDEALLRLCRLCCAIRVHCGDMTVDEATRFFRDECYYQETPARQEAVRATHDPGYLNYALGKLMILKLRRDWQQQEGDKFTLQRFHDEMLRHGALPLPLLRQVMLKDRASWPAAL
jgi:uncharacterized protein (DUF885 family)